MTTWEVIIAFVLGQEIRRLNARIAELEAAQ